MKLPDLDTRHLQPELMDAAEVGGRFASADAKRSNTFRALYRRTGVDKRHSVLLEGSEGAPMDRQSFYPGARGGDDPGPSTEVRTRRYEAEAAALENACVALAFGPGLVVEAVLLG